jgi:hypothetical protein
MRTEKNVVVAGGRGHWPGGLLTSQTLIVDSGDNGQLMQPLTIQPKPSSLMNLETNE